MNRVRSSLIVVKSLGKTSANEGVETVALREATFVIEKGEFVSIMEHLS